MQFAGFYWPVLAVVNETAWLTSHAPFRALRVVPVRCCRLVPNVVVGDAPWEIN